MSKEEKYLLAAYGSLKKNYWNHDAYLERSEYMGGIKTDAAYTLVDFGPYPAVLEGGTTGIHCEVYRVSKRTLIAVGRMELSAGYDVRVIDTKYGKTCFFVYTHDDCIGYPRVASGEWIPEEVDDLTNWITGDIAAGMEGVQW